jgi:hypothetical protein
VTERSVCAYCGKTIERRRVSTYYRWYANSRKTSWKCERPTESEHYELPRAHMPSGPREKKGA